jgi:hypothetical protein
LHPASQAVDGCPAPLPKPSLCRPTGCCSDTCTVGATNKNASVACYRTNPILTTCTNLQCLFGGVVDDLDRLLAGVHCRTHCHWPPGEPVVNEPILLRRLIAECAQQQLAIHRGWPWWPRSVACCSDKVKCMAQLLSKAAAANHCILQLEVSITLKLQNSGKLWLS